MELQLLFNALSKAILTSVIQGLIIYVFLRMALSFLTDISASQRYRILYSSLLLMFGSFIYTLSKTYQGLKLLSGTSEMSSAFATSVAVETNNLQWNYTSVLGWIYLAGVLGHLLYLLVGFIQLRHIKRSAFGDSIWNDRLAEFKERFSITSKVRLRLSSDMLVPFTAGFLRPIIVLPIAMINRLSPAQVEAILLHELAHIKRADYLFNLIQKMIESALFFNPFMWILSKEIRIEREFCCDDLVMQANHDPHLYAHALLRVAESKLSLCTSGVSFGGPGKFSLLNRIKRLYDIKTISSNPGSAVLGFVGLILAGISIAWVTPQKPVVKPELAQLRWIDTDTIRPAERGPSTSMNERNNQTPVLYLSTRKPTPNIDTIPPRNPKIVVHTDTDGIEPHVLREGATQHAKEMQKNAEALKSHARELERKFNSPEWKKSVEELRINALEMQRYQQSPEFKRMIEQAESDAKEMSKKFDTPEWKSQIKAMAKAAGELQHLSESPEWKASIEKIQLDALEMKKQIESRAWKAAVEKMKADSEGLRQHYQSKEWKENLEKSQKEADALRKEN